MASEVNQIRRFKISTFLTLLIGGNQQPSLKPGEIWLDSFAWEAIKEDILVDHASAVPELVDAIRKTVEYVGNDMLPAIEGWSWYDALKHYAPEVAERFLTNPVNFPSDSRVVESAMELVKRHGAAIEIDGIRISQVSWIEPEPTPESAASTLSETEPFVGARCSPRYDNGVGIVRGVDEGGEIVAVTWLGDPRDDTPISDLLDPMRIKPEKASGLRFDHFPPQSRIIEHMLVDSCYRTFDYIAEQFDSEIEYMGSEIIERIRQDQHLLEPGHPKQGEECIVCKDFNSGGV